VKARIYVTIQVAVMEIRVEILAAEARGEDPAEA
jgi:hypothetical protein